MRLYRAIRAVVAAAFLALAACTPVGMNQPLAPEALAPEGSRTITTGGYRLASLASNDTSSDMLVVVAFSGGGTRSAALSLGVLKGLRDTAVHSGGRDRRLLDEIDIISSVSGGSMIAAYYGLHREGVFTDFETDFLRRDINAEVYGIYLLPWNWRWLVDPLYGTNDAMQAIYDRHMYHGATFADLQQRGRPLLLIQASDISFGTVFTFTQDQFDVLCSDLSRMPVARAVAASAGCRCCSRRSRSPTTSTGAAAAARQFCSPIRRTLTRCRGSASSEPRWSSTSTAGAPATRTCSMAGSPTTSPCAA